MRVYRLYFFEPTGGERKTFMNPATEHRGVRYIIPKTDDGVWRWVLYPERDKRGVFSALNRPPRPTYPSYAAAAQGAVAAIDRVLGKG